MAERIVIGSWSFESPCCHLEDIAGVYTAPTVRGDDRTIPGAQGEAVRRRVLGPIFFELVGFIHGEVDPDGLAHTTPRVGLLDNWQDMTDAILPPSTPPYTRTIVHHLDDDTSRSAECIVTAIEGPHAVGSVGFQFGIQVKVPAGMFTVDV